MILGNPWVHGGVVGFVVVNFLMVTFAWSVWFERKFAGRMQNRPGPTEVGPFGLLQPIADLLKLLQKQDIVPDGADRALFNLAPPIGAILILASAAALPFGPGLVAADLDVGVLFALSITSLMVIPVWMAGWASNNKYALLGAMRAAAQAVSFEVPLLLSAMVPIVLAGSFSIADIVAAQSGYAWFALWPPGPGLVAFVLFFLTSLAEANRIPFDIPEAESELVAGVTTEYTGMKFGLFYLAEYVHTLVASLLATVLFLGGWEGPFVDGPHWMIAKALGLYAFIFWVRWTLLRYRADQFMALCWKVLVPTSLATLVAAALWKHLS
ncbi:MAG: NADH-quinone oxidoreductase subunit NuoH [Deltaproteobacteria bacterium]|nr:NADH-quinone oxidoreductase subunit NuoH [Deltaproteobacteria bacterium]MBM4391941.1 NADH-quinone oxidoreductase subunit NuoH [Deltaproteobacteria bacterium]